MLRDSSCSASAAPRPRVWPLTMARVVCGVTRVLGRAEKTSHFLTMRAKSAAARPSRRAEALPVLHRRRADAPHKYDAHAVGGAKPAVVGDRLERGGTALEQFA